MERGFWKEYFCYGMNVTLAGASGTVFTGTEIRIDSDADFEFHKSMFVATDGQIRIKLKDEAVGRYLTKNEIDIRTIAGTALSGVAANGFTPFVWPRPYLISKGSKIVVEASDYSGSSNIFRLAFHGAKIRKGIAPWKKSYRAIVPFTYGIKETIGASSTVSSRIEIDSDSHFIVKKITGISTATYSYLVQVKEGGTDRDWFNTPIHWDNIIGNGQFANNLSANRFLLRGSVLIFQLQNLLASSKTAEINIIGEKLYE